MMTIGFLKTGIRSRHNTDQFVPDLNLPNTHVKQK